MVLFLLAAAQLIIFRGRLIMNTVAKFGSRSLVKVMGETAKIRTVSANKVSMDRVLGEQGNCQIRKSTNKDTVIFI